MRRWITFGILALLLGGCKSGTKVVDPFVGRTRVEPPRTGTISTPGDPFYPGQTAAPAYSYPGQTTFPGQSTALPSGLSPGWTPMIPSGTPNPPGAGSSPPSGVPSGSYPPSGSSPYAPGSGTPGPSGSLPTGRSNPATGNPLPSAGGTPVATQGFPPAGASTIAIPTSSSPTSAGTLGSMQGPGGGPPSGMTSSPQTAASGLKGQPIVRTLPPRPQGTTPQSGVYPASSGGTPSAGVSSPPGGVFSSPTGGTGGNPSPPGSAGWGTSPASVDLTSLPAGPSGLSSGPTAASVFSGGMSSSSPASGALPRSNPSGGSSSPGNLWGGNPGGASAQGSGGSASAPNGGNVSAGGTGSSAGTGTGGYGFDPQYQWLRGVLCYSAAERCWRLRYVPPGCPPDRLGGWIILCHPSGLAGLNQGEQVEVRGELVYKQVGHCQTPIYQVREIHRINR